VIQQTLLTNFPSTIFATAKRKTQAAIRAVREKAMRDSEPDRKIVFLIAYDKDNE